MNKESKDFLESPGQEKNIKVFIITVTTTISCEEVSDIVLLTNY